MSFCKSIVFCFYHIYIKREGNFCVDKLANFGTSSHDIFSWWVSGPILLGKNSLGIKFLFLTIGFVSSPLRF